MKLGPAERSAFERYLAKRAAGVGGFDSPACARSFISELVDSSNDADYLRRYQDHCPMSGADPGDYAATAVRLDSDCTIIAAIHFRGRSVDFPFVDVSAQTAALPHPLPVATVAGAFGRFRPRAIRTWRAEGEPCPEAGQDDLVIVGGDLRVLRSAPEAPGFRPIRLEADRSVSFYAEYCDLYEMASAVSARTGGTTLETRESLSKCGQAGALYRVVIDDHTAGVIGARPDSYRQWRGWHIVEEVLHPRFRGHRLAPAVQRAFLRNLDVDREPFVFGTIDATNAPSLKTALRVGRCILEIGALVPIAMELHPERSAVTTVTPARDFVES